MINIDWYIDSQLVHYCRYCGAEVYELTPSKFICFKCKRVIVRGEAV